MKYTVLCTGSLKERYWREAEQEYKKRLGRFGSWNVVELSECPLPERPSQGEIQRALQKEGEALIRRIPPRSFVIALCVEGRQLTSEELAAKLGDRKSTRLNSSHGS